MTQITQSENATSQDVMTTLRDLLNTMREVLARMPVVRGDAGGSVPTAGAKELSDALHAVPRYDERLWREREAAARTDDALRTARRREYDALQSGRGSSYVEQQAEQSGRPSDSATV